MAYTPSQANEVNNLLKGGLSTADAAKQANISTPADFAIGNNGEVGGLIPGAGATPATTQSTFQSVSYPQLASGQPAQGVQLAAAAPPVFNGVVNRDGTITFFTPGQDQTLSTGPATTTPAPAISASGRANSVPATPPPTTTTQNVGPFASGYRGVAGPLTEGPPLPNNTVTPVDVTGTSLGNQPAADPVITAPTNNTLAVNPFATRAITPVPSTAEPFRVEVTGTGTNQSAAEDARLARAPGPVFSTPGAAQLGQGGTVPTAEPFRVEVTGPGFVQAPGEQGRGTATPTASPVPVQADDATGVDQQVAANAAADAAANQSAAEDARLARDEAAAKFNTTQQATLQSTYKQPGNGDWRFRISLAEGADYLYKFGGGSGGGGAGVGAGILAPLATTNGVVFPYTPTVTTSYQAKYNTYDLVHSNYRGVFYQNSSVSEISVKGVFTAQDTKEAEYVLAVIHFFRSVTKMFYGQDKQRGAPPPLVYLTGLGDYQFNAHPAVVTNFEYSLPNDVDYIRSNNPNNFGTDLLNRRAGALSPPSNPLSAIATRLGLSGLFPGATPVKPSYGPVTNSVTNTAKATYVPTKIEIGVSLLPVQTRDQVSKEFSLEKFANGNLLRGGFW